jgi:hypothetical protein
VAHAYSRFVVDYLLSNAVHFPVVVGLHPVHHAVLVVLVLGLQGLEAALQGFDLLLGLPHL